MHLVLKIWQNGATYLLIERMNVFKKTFFCFISWFKIKLVKGFNACCHEIKDCVDIVKRAKHKLQVLEKEVDALNAHLAILKIGPNFENNEEVGVALRALQSMQRKFDAQQCILEEFKKIFKAFQAKHKVMAQKVFYSWRGFKRCHRKAQGCGRKGFL